MFWLSTGLSQEEEWVVCWIGINCGCLKWAGTYKEVSMAGCFGKLFVILLWQDFAAGFFCFMELNHVSFNSCSIYCNFWWILAFWLAIPSWEVRSSWNCLLLLVMAMRTTTMSLLDYGLSCNQWTGFLFWCQQVEPVIRAHKLHSFLLNSHIPVRLTSIESATDNHISPEFEAWEQQDQLLLVWL
jgi:hypothetical protein